MSERREGWANVYVYTYVGGVKFCDVGSFQDRETSVAWADDAPDRNRFRVHVKLKPEDAPKRYRDERNRRAWEVDPEECRHLMRTRSCPAVALSRD